MLASSSPGKNTRETYMLNTETESAAIVIASMPGLIHAIRHPDAPHLLRPSQEMPLRLPGGTAIRHLCEARRWPDRAFLAAGMFGRLAAPHDGHTSGRPPSSGLYPQESQTQSSESSRSSVIASNESATAIIAASIGIIAGRHLCPDSRGHRATCDDIGSSRLFPPEIPDG